MDIQSVASLIVFVLLIVTALLLGRRLEKGESKQDKGFPATREHCKRERIGDFIKIKEAKNGTEVR